MKIAFQDIISKAHLSIFEEISLISKIAKKIKTLITMIITATMLAVTAAPVALSAPNEPQTFTPTVTTLRIGLFFGDTALPSANLQNVEGLGSGFDFGYFDTGRNFVNIGAFTEESRITILMDRNMVWHSGAGGFGEYREGTSGSVVVGAFHIQRHQGFDTFEEAKAEADRFEDAFVRYQTDRFLVLHGQYTSSDAARNAISRQGLSGATVNSGTANTLTVTRTGTNTILFEFERGTTPLGVMPRPIGEEKPETWFRGFRYNGGFQYSRRDGALLTVLNMVDIEDYTKGVLPYEMSNTWPLEALKAQALCARTYAMRSLNRHPSHGFDLCVLEHCQVYRGRGLANARTDQAVDETAGMYVTHNGVLAQTFYASSNGGASENVENVWTETRPYLRGVFDPYEADVVPRISNYNWTITYTPAQLTARMRDRVSGFNLSTIASMRVSQFSSTGNVVSVTMTDVNGRSQTFSRRTQLVPALGVPTQRFSIGGARFEPGGIFVNSPAQHLDSDTQVFTIDGSGAITAVPQGGVIHAITGTGNIETVTGEAGTATGGSTTGLVNGVFRITGTGNGHNVGMSQWGAFSMAHYHNKTFEEIIHFYFTGVEITRTIQ